MSARPREFWPKLVPGAKGTLVWRYHGLEHGYRGQASEGDPRFEKFLDECWEAQEHYDAGRHHAIKHLSSTRHHDRPGLKRKTLVQPHEILARAPEEVRKIYGDPEPAGDQE